ncbi:uncharacterized protein METZ01_LOCUS409271, partial [marine metagenome]
IHFIINKLKIEISVPDFGRHM